MVQDLAWRPNGKLIAVVYKQSNFVHLIDVENKNILHKTEQRTERLVTTLSWLSLENPDNDKSNERVKISYSSTGEYLPPLPSLNRSFGHEPEHKESLSQTLDMLFVRLEISKRYFFFGNFISLTVLIFNKGNRVLFCTFFRSGWRMATSQCLFLECLTAER